MNTSKLCAVGNQPTRVIPAERSDRSRIHARDPRRVRRDLTRLEALAPDIERLGVSEPVRSGWAAFRDALQRHHTAEDDDLWPVLRTHLIDTDDRGEVDAMVEEHRAIPTTIAALDAALARGIDVTAAADELGAIVRGHLDHEERTVFPLLERHLSRGVVYRRVLEPRYRVEHR